MKRSTEIRSSNTNSIAPALARFFPVPQPFACPCRGPRCVAERQVREATSWIRGTNHAIFLSTLPLEFETTCDAAVFRAPARRRCNVVAVQYHEGRKAVASNSRKDVRLGMSREQNTTSSTPSSRPEVTPPEQWEELRSLFPLSGAGKSWKSLPSRRQRISRKTIWSFSKQCKLAGRLDSRFSFTVRILLQQTTLTPAKRARG